MWRGTFKSDSKTEKPLKEVSKQQLMNLDLMYKWTAMKMA